MSKQKPGPKRKLPKHRDIDERPLDADEHHDLKAERSKRFYRKRKDKRDDPDAQ